MQEQFQIDATLLANTHLQGDYHQLDVNAPDIARTAKPGQFVHIQIPGLKHRVLRRPFSIYDTDANTGRLSVVYKKVGEGTEQLATITQPGVKVNVMGPLGNAYAQPIPEQDGRTRRLIIVDGGYGCAATFLLAKNATIKPVVLIGGRSAIDILLVKQYTDLGCTVRVSTNDGSMGDQGLVTKLLQEELDKDNFAQVAACGPNPMLKAVADMTVPADIPTQISLDQPMCCGIGACFACVVKVVDETNADGWHYSRSCMEGPVYDARNIYWN